MAGPAHMGSYLSRQTPVHEVDARVKLGLLLLATVALFAHGGSSAAAMGHILNLPFPYACALFHIEFTGITIIRLDRNPGRQALPCLELANDGRHIRGACYHRLADM